MSLIKKIFLILITSAIAVSTQAQDTIAQGNCGKQGNNLTWTLTYDGVDSILTISGSGAMANYTYSSHAPWYDYRAQMKHLIIGDSVTVIGNYAFAYCDGFFGNLIISNNITTIGEYAFGGCSALTAIDVDSGNTKYSSDDGVLFNKNKTTLICCPAGKAGIYTIPSSVTKIELAAFADCSGLIGPLNIPNSVTIIGYQAFLGCSGFDGTLTIPNSVKNIGGHAFSRCSGLTGSLTIPNSVTSIGDWAFAKCSGFTGSLTIPNSITSIGSWVFAGCSGLTGSLTIPNSVANIGDYAFYGCSGFSGDFKIPNSVKTIGEYTFGWCSGFSGNLIIPNSVTSIGGGAFQNCTGFTGNLTIPNSVAAIGENAFQDCKGFGGNLAIGNSVTTIGEYAFYGCIGFTGDLTIPNSVTTIGKSAFKICLGFNGSLTIGNSVSAINDYVFENCSGFKGNLTIPNSVTAIGDMSFGACTGLTSITSHATTPPTLGLNVFYDVSKTIPVYITCGTISDYKNATGWSYFTNYQTKSFPTPTDLIVTQQNATLELSWQNTAATNYEIYRNGTSIATVSTNTYTDSEVTNGTNYCYQVKAVNGANCESKFSAEVCETFNYTGIDNYQLGINNYELTISPNPTSGQLKIGNYELGIISNIEIYDVFGKKLKNITNLSSDGSFSISELPNGVYVVKIFANEQVYIQKVVKM